MSSARQTKGGVSNRILERDRNADDVAKYLSKWPTRCLIHEEPVVSYCADHDQIICNVCGLSTHNQCDGIVGFHEAAKGFLNSREVTILSGNLKKLKEKYEKNYQVQTDLYNEVTERDKIFVKAVRSFRDEINAILERLENAIIARKDDFVIQKKNVFKEHKELSRTATVMLENYMKDIDRSFLKGDDESVFIAVKKSKTVLDEYTVQMKLMQQAPKKVNIEFEPNKQIEKFFLNLKDLGTMKTSGDPIPEVDIQLPVINKSMERRMSVASNLTIDRSLELSLGAKSDRRRGSRPMIDTTTVGKAQVSKGKTRRPTIMGETPVSIDSDVEEPFITGLTFMPDDHVVCIDDANKAVKLFSAALKLTASLKLSLVPRDVAAVKSQLVVVTLPADKSLQFIELGRELLQKNKLQLEIECSGVTCFQHELYVTSGFSVDRQIQVVSLKGIVRKRIRPGIADLRYPLYVTVEPKMRMLFVTDYNHGVIGIGLNNDEVQFKCKDTDVHGYYKGITIANKGHIYTCTWNLNGVSRVHLDGRGLETIIPMPDKEGRKPHSIAYSSRSSRLLVSMCGGKRGCLSVYKVQ